MSSAYSSPSDRTVIRGLLPSEGGIVHVRGNGIRGGLASEQWDRGFSECAPSVGSSGARGRVEGGGGAVQGCTYLALTARSSLATPRHHGQRVRAHAASRSPICCLAKCWHRHLPTWTIATCPPGPLHTPTLQRSRHALCAPRQVVGHSRASLEHVGSGSCGMLGPRCPHLRVEVVRGCTATEERTSDFSVFLS